MQGLFSLGWCYIARHMDDIEPSGYARDIDQKTIETGLKRQLESL